jgi:hypothetical protein
MNPIKQKKQEMFKNLSTDHQLFIIKAQLDLYTSAISSKMGILPIVSTLSIAMLSIMTLNSEILPLTTTETEVIISFLLFITPISLIIFINDKQKAANSAMEIIKEYTKKDPREEIEIKFRDKVTSFFFLFSITGFAVAIFYLIIVILLR